MPSPRRATRDLVRLLGILKPHRATLGAALVSLFAASAFGLSLPQILRQLIDAALVQRDGQRLHEVMLLLVGVLVGQVVFAFLRSFLLSYTAERVVADLRVRLCENLLGLSSAFFAYRSVGELTSRVASDVSMLAYALTACLGQLVRQSVVLVGSIVIVATMSPRLMLSMFWVVPVVAVAAVMVYGGYLRRVSTSVQDSLAEAGDVLNSSLSGIRIVQSFVREDHEKQRYRQRILRAVSLATRRSMIAGLFTAFAMLMVFLGLASVLWFGGRMVLSGELSVGDLSAFVLYMFVVAFTVSGIIDQYGTIQQALGSARRVFELLDARPEIVEPETPVRLGRARGQVRLDRVSMRYKAEGPLVLSRVSLEAKPGELIALVGPSGAGKSTLVSLIPRFYDPTEGTVQVDGHDVRSLSLRDLRGAIGMVPQETVLFGGTIRENIAYGKLEATDAEVEAAARAAHAHEFIRELDGGYDAVVGQRGMTLSGGQRQRIAIARALLKDPAILILDEATSALDSESERLVQDAMEVLMRGRTTFVIAHRLATVRSAGTIVVLDRGHVVEVGTHEELRSASGLYRQLSDLQLRDREGQDASAVLASERERPRLGAQALG